MVLIVELTLFLHLPPYKNCRKTHSERAVLCVDIIYATWVCVWDLLFAVPVSGGIAKEAC